MNGKPWTPTTTTGALDKMQKLTTEQTWFNPATNPPPFDLLIWVILAGIRTNDCGQTWETYTQVNSVKVLTTGPGDEYDDISAHDEFMAGDQSDFLEFQFDLEDYGSEDQMDWYSDAIVAWAYHPFNAVHEMMAWHAKADK